MARTSKLSDVMRRVIATPRGTAAVHRAAMNASGIARVHTGTEDVLIFTRDGGRHLRFTADAKRKYRK